MPHNDHVAESTTTNWNSFARINASQRWRRPSAAMGRNVTEAIVREARVADGMDVLDIACGTGEPAISIATSLHGSGSVVAADISPDPLEVAKQRAAERGLTNISFVPADVHALPFPDASFDRITCRLGVMFFADLPRALREMHRVLKRGGRATLLAWGPMQQPYFESTIGTVLRSLPGLEIPPSGAKMFKFGVAGALGDALRQAGFEQVEEKFTDIPWNWPGSPEDFWEYFRDVTVPFKPLFERIPEDRRDEVHAKALAAITRHYDGNEVKFNARMLLASAFK